MALELIAADDAKVQRHLAMRTAILEGEYLAARAAIERDRLARKVPTQDLPGPQFMRPGERIPMIGMRARAPQIDRTSLLGEAHRDYWSRVFSHEAG